MKILIISDIHGNIDGLQTVLNDVGKADQIFCAGDITGYYPFINEVIDTLRKKNVIAVKGNHDKYLLDGQAPVYANSAVAESVQRMKQIVTKESLEYLKSLPNPKELEIDGRKVLLVHATPWDPYEERIYPDNGNFDRFTSLPYQIVIYGHTHYPLIKHIEKKIIVNPGSCGQPRDYGLLSYAIWDTGVDKFINKRIEWDLENFKAKAKKFGTPEALFSYFERKKEK